MLDPRLRPEHSALAYEHCAHHLELPADRWEEPPQDRPGIVPRAYLAYAYGYDDGLPRWRRALALLAVPHPEGAEAVRFSVMYLSPVAGGELLDVGCGGGAFLDRMRALGWRVLGVDSEPRAVEFARTHRGLDVVAGTLEEQRFSDGRFDAVTASHVVEHVHNPRSFLRECARVTRPGGRVVLVTPNIESLGRRRLGGSWIGLDPPRHLHLFSRATLSRLAEQAGLEVRSVRSSVRNAEFSWLLGKGFLREWPAPGQRPPRGWTGRRARAFQLAEWALTLMGRHAGEEIVLIASKP
ncbi:MAG TPA: class I SAM-dependent methyltransferase [Gemmatimonadales bacterium]|nr:class I SAM-dependent methyltransferase [Gemmatimonadales bacterium]